MTPYSSIMNLNNLTSNSPLWEQNPYPKTHTSIFLIHFMLLILLKKRATQKVHRLDGPFQVSNTSSSSDRSGQVKL